MTDGAMTAFLTNIGLFFTQSIEWLSTVLDTVVSSPALLVMCIAMPVCGFAVGLLGRLFRVN